MKLEPRIRLHASNYFKKKSKKKLFTSILLFFSGILAAYPGVIKLFSSFSTDGFTTLSFNALVADTAVSILMIILPVVAFFFIGYMILENHSLGWKLSFAISAIAVVLGVTNFLNIEWALSIGILSALAGTIDIRDIRRIAKGEKDSPTVTENLAKVGLGMSGALCISVLFGMLLYIVVRAVPYFTWSFLTNTNWLWQRAGFVLNGVQSGSLGGISGYTIGSLLIVFVCELIAIPLGLGAAIYMAEYATQNKFTDIIRFFIETLAGVPSVVIGLIGLAVFVDGGLKIGYSLIGGGLSLAFMILPWNIRVAEEAIKAVPAAYREASFALGATKWQTVRLAVLFAALPGVITGILLGGGAALGETVVVWLTAGDAVNVSNFNLSQLFNLHQAIPTLTVFIWRAPTLLSVGAGLAKSGSLYNYYSVAFAAALVLIAIYLAICFLALILRNYLNKKIRGN